MKEEFSLYFRAIEILNIRTFFLSLGFVLCADVHGFRASVGRNYFVDGRLKIGKVVNDIVAGVVWFWGGWRMLNWGVPQIMMSERREYLLNFLTNHIQ